MQYFIFLRPIVLYLLMIIQELFYAAPYHIPSWDIDHFFSLFHIGISADVYSYIIHHDEKGAGLQACSQIL
jgi:hypothetical protein